MALLHVRPRSWVIFIAAGWLILLAPVVIPASFWLTVDKVFVHDTVAGSTPLMDVERTIHRQFRAKWIATVLREGRFGTFSAFCSARGVNDYRPDNDLPDVVDLNWWTWPTRCVLPEGRYVLHTLWTIEAPFFPDKEVRIESNVFAIKPR